MAYTRSPDLTAAAVFINLKLTFIEIIEWWIPIYKVNRDAQLIIGHDDHILKTISRLYIILCV